jgi:hypothetical protein
MFFFWRNLIAPLLDLTSSLNTQRPEQGVGWGGGRVGVLVIIKNRAKISINYLHFNNGRRMMLQKYSANILAVVD